MLSELARAKINLTLSVLGRRPDGYHALESLVVFAEMGDLVSLEPAPDVAVETTGRFAAAIDGPNLVMRAAAGARSAAPQVKLGRFRIEKHIPVAAGLGGGSADAAAALRLIQRLNPELSEAPWGEIAARLGADVPVCLASAPSLMWGIGERLLPLPALPAGHLVLANSLTPVPRDKTASVFRLLSATPLRDLPGAPMPIANLSDVSELASLIRDVGNSLLPAARQVMPEIGQVLAALAATRDCLAVGLSGAGPSCFALYATARSATAAARAIEAAAPAWWVKPAGIAAAPPRPAGQNMPF